MNADPTALIRLSTDPAAAPWRLFGAPVAVIQTRQLDEVAACLREVEARCRDEGLHAVGFVSYEAAPAFEPALRVVPDSEDGPPLLYFALYDTCQAAPPDAGTVPEAYALGPWTADVDEEQYARDIARIRAEIAAGTTYQTNYTRRWQAPFAGDPLAWFRARAAAQPTPYAAYLNLGRWRVLSWSPELFFRVQGDRLTTRPMKGTVARGRTEIEAAAQAAWLSTSEKNRAENVMIVDLLRNDLGRVAQVGSVAVTALCEVETYPTLHTLTSTVQARRRAGTTLADVFGALFPCGSVTGAPKISTMRLIAALEGRPRRVYCGAVGYVAPNGDAVFSVPIRTALLDTQTGVAEYGAGGGITWDSEAADEYREMRTKMRVLTSPAPTFDLLETLRLEAGQYVSPGDHLDRMASSARYFGFGFPEAALRAELDRAAQAHPAGVWRVRLLLRGGGEVSATATPLDAAGPHPLRATLAADPVDSGDVFLSHKTTRRAVYEAAAASVPPGHEALLRNERGELTVFTTGNVVLRLGGRRYTPPVACGLLAGTARGRALAAGEVHERVLTVADLAQAEAVWHLNTLRGWRRVEMGAWDVEGGP